ncbi:hypothetical protein DFJ73DRAFT_784423 [Zopfochytrium polystomum]|nr:hypothetical protein DFJ73DRAFT_784423 [Zopfochytrium polystomum]
MALAAASRCGFCYDEDVLNAVEWWAARGAVLDANKTALNQAAAAKNVPFLEPQQDLGTQFNPVRNFARTHSHVAGE